MSSRDGGGYDGAGNYFDGSSGGLPDRSGTIDWSRELLQQGSGLGLSVGGCEYEPTDAPYSSSVHPRRRLGLDFVDLNSGGGCAGTEHFTSLLRPQQPSPRAATPPFGLPAWCADEGPD